MKLDLCFDLRHGLQRNCIGIIKSAKLWSHELLMLLIWNSRHGPWMSKQRAEQVGRCMDDYFSLMTPDGCPLF